jgi:hypothetical protein
MSGRRAGIKELSTRSRKGRIRTKQQGEWKMSKGRNILVGLVSMMAIGLVGCTSLKPIIETVDFPDGKEIVTNMLPVAPTAETPSGLPALKWHGPTLQPNAKQTIVLRSARITGDKVTYDYDTPKNMGDCTHLAGCFLQRGGTNKWEGGKYEWLHKGQKTKELSNIIGKTKKDKATDQPILDSAGNKTYSYYIKALIPIAEGEPSRHIIFKADGSEYSNMVDAEGGMPKSK